jgi:hypothetical protein
MKVFWFYQPHPIFAYSRKRNNGTPIISLSPFFHIACVHAVSLQQQEKLFSFILIAAHLMYVMPNIELQHIFVSRNIKQINIWQYMAQFELRDSGAALKLMQM